MYAAMSEMIPGFLEEQAAYCGTCVRGTSMEALDAVPQARRRGSLPPPITVSRTPSTQEGMLDLAIPALLALETGRSDEAASSDDDFDEAALCESQDYGPEVDASSDDEQDLPWDIAVLGYDAERYGEGEAEELKACATKLGRQAPRSMIKELYACLKALPTAPRVKGGAGKTLLQHTKKGAALREEIKRALKALFATWEAKYEEAGYKAGMSAAFVSHLPEEMMDLKARVALMKLIRENDRVGMPFGAGPYMFAMFMSEKEQEDWSD